MFRSCLLYTSKKGQVDQYGTSHSLRLRGGLRLSLIHIYRSDYFVEVLVNIHKNSQHKKLMKNQTGKLARLLL